MKFLITDYFFKSIPLEKNEKVLNRLNFFYDCIKNNNLFSFDFPKGFWTKKIKGTNSLFEFRVDNGDRIFFILNNYSRETDGNIIFLLYSSHDRAVKKAKRKELQSYNLENFITFNENDDIQFIDEIHFNWNNVITYEILEDTDFVENYSKNKYKYYYLNDEQYSCLAGYPPYFIAGSAGSGKSTLTLRKLLNLEENYNTYEYSNILYLTANQYLKENSEEQYLEFRFKQNPPIGHFYTIKDFFAKHLNIKRKQIIGLEKFKEFLFYSYPNYKKFKLSPEEIFSEINGIIKGIMIFNKADNWNRDLSNSLITLDTYLNLSSKYSVLSKDIRIQMYSIAEKYNSWLKDNKLFDLNDLSIMLYNLHLKYDFIIIDEVQDLTELQIFSLVTLAKDRENIFLAGDIHQMVNSTYFNFDRIKNLFYSNYNKNVDIKVLSKNYRSCKKIVALANHFSSLRSEYIGNLGIEDYKEISIQKEGDISLTSPNLALIRDAQNDVNFAIVVPDENTKYELYEKLDNKHRIFTIPEIKGLEYKNIICYNLTSKYQDEWKKIFSKKVKQDQRYRKFFNIFYVGITRAQENLIIMEENIQSNLILKQIKDFLVKDDNLTFVHEVKDIKQEKKDWLKEGIKLYKLEKIEEAQYAFELAGEPTWIIEREIENDITDLDFDLAIKKINIENLSGKQNHYKKLIIDTAINHSLYMCALEKNQIFGISYREKEIKEGIKNSIENSPFSSKEINKIIQFYKKKKDFLFVGDILLGIKKYKEALVHYQNLSNQTGISLARKGLLTEEFSLLPNFDEKIKELDSIIEEKNINTFNKKDKLTSLHRALVIKKDPILFNMILSLGGNIHTFIKGKYTIPEYFIMYPPDTKNNIDDFFNIFYHNGLTLSRPSYISIYLNSLKLFKYLLSKDKFTLSDTFIEELQNNISLETERTIRSRKLLLMKQIIKNHKK